MHKVAIEVQCPGFFPLRTSFDVTLPDTDRKTEHRNRILRASVHDTFASVFKFINTLGLGKYDWYNCLQAGQGQSRLRRIRSSQDWNVILVDYLSDKHRARYLILRTGLHTKYIVLNHQAVVDAFTTEILAKFSDNDVLYHGSFVWMSSLVDCLRLEETTSSNTADSISTTFIYDDADIEYTCPSTGKVHCPNCNESVSTSIFLSEDVVNDLYPSCDSCAFRIPFSEEIVQFLRIQSGGSELNLLPTFTANFKTICKRYSLTYCQWYQFLEQCRIAFHPTSPPQAHTRDEVWSTLLTKESKIYQECHSLRRDIESMTTNVKSHAKRLDVATDANDTKLSLEEKEEEEEDNDGDNGDLDTEREQLEFVLRAHERQLQNGQCATEAIVQRRVSMLRNKHTSDVDVILNEHTSFNQVLHTLKSIHFRDKYNRFRVDILQEGRRHVEDYLFSLSRHIRLKRIRLGLMVSDQRWASLQVDMVKFEQKPYVIPVTLASFVGQDSHGQIVYNPLFLRYLEREDVYSENDAKLHDFLVSVHNMNRMVLAPTVMSTVPYLESKLLCRIHLFAKWIPFKFNPSLQEKYLLQQSVNLVRRLWKCLCRKDASQMLLPYCALAKATRGGVTHFYLDCGCTFEGLSSSNFPCKVYVTVHQNEDYDSLDIFLQRCPNRFCRQSTVPIYKDLPLIGRSSGEENGSAPLEINSASESCPINTESTRRGLTLTEYASIIQENYTSQ